jgi:maltose alpha-D-glucosyltransferase/alpha-amylase
MLGGNRRQIELAHSLMFTLPGTPVMHYGDEIGMGDNLSLNERDAVRMPMQWSDEPQSGFSTTEKKTVLPVIKDEVWSYERINVASQRRDPHSLLNWMERIVCMRKECPEFGWGTWKILNTRNSSVLGMRYDWRNNSIVTLHNFGSKPHGIILDIGVKGGKNLVNLFAENHSKAKGNGKHHIILEPYGYRWYRVGGMSHILRREKL